MTLAAVVVICAMLASLGCNTNGRGADDATMCSTSECEEAPCTPGCVFTLPTAEGCTGLFPARLPRAEVLACPRFCGLIGADVPGLVGCWTYHGEYPGCGICGYRWGDQSCVERRPMADYRNGGAICDPGWGCQDGRAPPDAGFPCDDVDMFPKGD